MSLGTEVEKHGLTLDYDEDEEIQVCNTSKLFVQVLWNEGEDGIFCGWSKVHRTGVEIRTGRADLVADIDIDRPSTTVDVVWTEGHVDINVPPRAICGCRRRGSSSLLDDRLVAGI
jgi:hypothetical protein